MSGKRIRRAFANVFMNVFMKRVFWKHRRRRRHKTKKTMAPQSMSTLFLCPDVFLSHVDTIVQSPNRFGLINSTNFFVGLGIAEPPRLLQTEKCTERGPRWSTSDNMSVILDPITADGCGSRYRVHKDFGGEDDGKNFEYVTVWRSDAVKELRARCVSQVEKARGRLKFESVYQICRVLDTAMECEQGVVWLHSRI